ncbi:MAG TPA: Crp/Fnr family transcriptional regulator [Ideonella sp.]|uniref:Crp/Fnr family transcriptional regulator n=1 Tax=Ideonella sp. TaxID=1929293 RepID=UPI002E370420|nr:Crp/Fnr family transcriptional regulator [Ideonella sp.]HEX5685806.1 Crp/Fnr family transcriptional regulator [Ideonella sp.]
MCSVVGPRTNRLISGLPEDARQRLLPRLEEVEVFQGRVLHQAGCQMSHVYFPTTAVVSLMYETADGAPMELAVAGNEGMIGIELILGGGSTPSQAVVRDAGQVVRLPALAIQDEFARAGSAMHLLLRYTAALITQVAQTAVCSRHHSLDQRLCRWLLMSMDRVQGNELAVTQDRIANMLGVRREGVTIGAQRLQEMGLIRCARGRIGVLDREGLEKQACECYAVIKKEYERLLPEALDDSVLWPSPAVLSAEGPAPAITGPASPMSGRQPQRQIASLDHRAVDDTHVEATAERPLRRRA